MADLEHLFRDSRWLCIQAEQCITRRLAALGVTAVQARILLYILHAGNQGISLTALHHTFGYSMATMSGMVKRLREKGYLVAKHCKEDDRRRLLCATEKSRRLQSDLEHVIDTVQSGLYEGLSPDELCTLDRLQGKMLHNLSALTAPKEESKS